MSNSSAAPVRIRFTIDFNVVGSTSVAHFLALAEKLSGKRPSSFEQALGTIAQQMGSRVDLGKPVSLVSARGRNVPPSELSSEQLRPAA